MKRFILDVSDEEIRMRWDELAVALVVASGGTVTLPKSFLVDPNAEHYLEFTATPDGGVEIRAVRRQAPEAD